MTRIAVLTSGGDAPGMNAAIRAVVRLGLARGFEVVGVRDGYTGLIAGNWLPLGPRDVGGIIGRGGTVLGTTRCNDLKTETGQAAAERQIRERDIDGLVVIGGNGSQAGAAALARRGVRVIGLASTIDNDLPGADITIGATTALDTAVEAIDRLRVTAASHHRAFLVEVMGRHHGFLGLYAGIAGGAEAVVLPEVNVEPETVAAEILGSYQRGKSHAIVVVAEGAQHDAEGLAAYFRAHAQRLGFELRVVRLGHLQRGGPPGVFDRMYATSLGAAAVEHVAAQRWGVLLGQIDGKVAATPLAAIAGATKPLDLELYRLAYLLAQ
ncbi:MAG: ATP-dependent 6-phosphofructokinase [Proteobacteria bacterium]|nr:ATP-dependent 6-phosphofructokinase [Pseudomonadota bacterium]